MMVCNRRPGCADFRTVPCTGLAAARLVPGGLNSGLGADETVCEKVREQQDDSDQCGYGNWERRGCDGED